MSLHENVQKRLPKLIKTREVAPGGLLFGVEDSADSPFPVPSLWGIIKTAAGLFLVGGLEYFFLVE